MRLLQELSKKISSNAFKNFAHRKDFKNPLIKFAIANLLRKLEVNLIKKILDILIALN
jgi:hypothetical protein